MAVPVGELPTQENCDPNDPEEAFLWMLIAMPGMKGAPVPFPIEYLREVSKRIWNCGARPGIEPQAEWYHPPQSGDISPMFAAGEWKPEPPVHERPDIDITKLSKVMQDEIRRQALELEGEPAPQQSPVQIMDEPTWPEKLRVHELAKRIGATSKEVVAVAQEIGLPTKSAQSRIPGDRCAAIRDQVRIKRAMAYRRRL
ncbi:translation initiation factor IF-2 N-terminal domain-containing protein [Rhodococcus sp. SJ-2]